MPARSRAWIFLPLLWIPVSLLAQGCGGARSDSPRPQTSEVSENFGSLERFDRALALAATYLVDRQDADGAWRSDTYGVFKDGPSLTPLVVDTLLRSGSSEACDKGAAYLAALVKADGAIDGGPHGLSYPLYTSALAVRFLTRLDYEKYGPAREAWLAFLR